MHTHTHSKPQHQIERGSKSTFLLSVTLLQKLADGCSGIKNRASTLGTATRIWSRHLWNCSSICGRGKGLFPSPKQQNCHWCPTSHPFKGYRWLFTCRCCSTGVNLTSHLHLVSWLWVYAAILPLPHMPSMSAEGKLYCLVNKSTHDIASGGTDHTQTHLI
jgi:hypothetical protein